jgi:predicted metal-dependent hydrolase
MPLIHLDDGRRVSYRIRISPRSRRVRLTLNPRDGLVMVSPPGVDRGELERLASDWRGWVARQIEQLGIGDLDPVETRQTLPENIPLRAIGEEWGLLYRYAPSSTARVLEKSTSSLVLSGDVADHAACAGALRRWLMRRARQTLPGWLQEVSSEIGLPFASVSVRGQRSRWGSCSAEGDISLNYQLLFLPRQLARHVLIHELCHTVELNHSPRFWRTVARHEPEVARLRAEMRRSWSHVPAWLNA